MSGKQIGYGLDKEFSRIKNWKEFLTRWEDVKTEEEAVGLLYSGANVPDSEYFVPSAEKLERISFYLDYIEHPNEKIATTVQQIIIRHWLKWLSGCLIGYDSGCLEITNRVLEFLQNPSESLLKPPHPRFVSEYLLPLHKEWRYGHSSDYGRGKGYQALQESTKLIVKALCTWGLGYVLAVDGLRPEIIPIIKEFLDERGYQTGEALFRISGYGEPPSDLSGSTGTEKVNYTAACAFLKLKFWVGGGFTAEFIKSYPPKYRAE